MRKFTKLFLSDHCTPATFPFFHSACPHIKFSSLPTLSHPHGWHINCNMQEFSMIYSGLGTQIRHIDMVREWHHAAIIVKVTHNDSTYRKCLLQMNKRHIKGHGTQSQRNKWTWDMGLGYSNMQVPQFTCGVSRMVPVIITDICETSGLEQVLPFVQRTQEQVGQSGRDTKNKKKGTHACSLVSRATCKSSENIEFTYLPGEAIS